MAPYMTPWSVMARAGISSLAAASTSGWMRLAPSSSENSVWLCRWTKVLGAYGIVWFGCGGPRDSLLGAGPGLCMLLVRLRIADARVDGGRVDDPRRAHRLWRRDQN